MFRQTRYFQIPIIVLLTILLLGSSACKKSGKIEHIVICTNDKNAFRMQMAVDDTFKSGLGNYITSITPYSVKARMNLLGFQDDWTENAHQVSYIDGHDNDPRYTIELYCDFSGNAEITPKPILYGTDMRDGIFEQKQVTMKYFLFAPYHIEIEFELPASYNNTPPKNGVAPVFDPTRNRYVCKANEGSLIYRIFQGNSKMPNAFLFGNTDTTFIYNKEGLNLPNSKDRYFGAPEWCVIRSHQFTPATITMPDDGETIKLISTIVYDTENIIQIYAGQDNQPYTEDDIFIYAPRYWERIKVKLESR